MAVQVPVSGAEREQGVEKVHHYGAQPYMADHEISGQQPLVVRKIGDTHRTSTFAQLKWAIQKLGVSDYWGHHLPVGADLYTYGAKGIVPWL